MHVIGHRGAKGLAPENTRASLKAGIAAGADWVEFDVRATKDGHVVVIHDPHTLRIARRWHTVAYTDYATLRKLRIHKTHTIPTIAEAFNAIGRQAKINVEIKTNGCAHAVVKNIERMVKNGASYSDFLVSSFHIQHLKEVHRSNPSINLGLLHFINPYKFLKIHGLRLQAAGFHWRFAPDHAIKQAKLRGLITYVYTVNDARHIESLKKRGVDAVVTNRPDKFVES